MLFWSRYFYIIKNKKKYMETILTKQQINEIIGGGLWENFGKLIEEQNKLYEGLIKTYPVNSTIKKIKKEFVDSMTSVEKSNGTESILVYLKNNSETDRLVKTMSVYGWFLAKPKPGERFIIKTINNVNYYEFRFEAKFDVNSSESIYHANGNNKPTFLYHITPAANMNNILTNGLSPKSNSKLGYHPERIYFLTNIEMNK